MKPVVGAPKDIVRRGYDECGPRYLEVREDAPPEILLQLTEMLPESASVLDLGCGAGHPVATTLARHAHVTGVDISETQVRAARAALPGSATVIHGDIMEVDLPRASFDAIVSFFTLFHLPRREHRALLERVAGWLKPRGLFLLTTARTDHSGYTEDNFFGVTMYWSHFGPDRYGAMLEELGFNVVERGALPPGTGDGRDHPTFLVRLGRASGDTL